MRRLLLAAFLALTVVASPIASATKAKEKPQETPQTTADSSVRVQSVDAFSKLDFILPDGQLTTSLGAKRGGSSIGLVTIYNFPRGLIDYTIRVGTMVKPWAVGLSGYNKVDFEQVLNQNKFIGRIRGGALDFSRGLGRRWNTDIVLSRQENYFIQLAGQAVPANLGIQSSRQNLVGLSLIKDNRDSADNPLVGFWHRTTTTQSIRQFGGDYEYNKIQWDYVNYYGWRFWRQSTTLRLGSPLYKFNYPAFEHFFLGGWDQMRGYPLYAQEGEKVVFIREEWTLPLFSMRGKVWKAYPKGVEILVSADAGRAGTGDRLFTMANEYKLSVAAGLGFRLSINDKIPVFLMVAFAKPMEHRKGIVYFRYKIR